MYSTFAEKTPLLPITEPSLEIAGRDQRRRGFIEYGLLVATLLLTIFHFFVLYSTSSSVPVALDGSFSALVAPFAGGLRTSILASLPTAAVLFVIAPFVAQKEHVVMARYTILVCYLVGSTLGALLL